MATSKQSFNARRLAKDIIDKRGKEGIPTRIACEDIGISKTTLFQLESAAGEPGFRIVVAACNWLGKPVYDYIDLTKPKAK